MESYENGVNVWRVILRGPNVSYGYKRNMVGRTDWRGLSYAGAHLFLTFPIRAHNIDCAGGADRRISFGSTGSIAQRLGNGDGEDRSRKRE